MNNGCDPSQSARDEAQSADADLADPPARREAPQVFVAGEVKGTWQAAIDTELITADPPLLSAAVPGTLMAACRRSCPPTRRSSLVPGTLRQHAGSWPAARPTPPVRSVTG